MRYYHFLIVIAIGVACSSQEQGESRTKSPRIRKVSSVVSPKNNQAFEFGDTITWEAKLKDPGSIDSMRLETMGTTVVFPGNAATWIPESPRAGFPRMKLTVFFDGSSEVHYPRVKLTPKDQPTAYTYQIVATYPHDTEAYIQGLFVHEGHFVESTGQRGASTLRRYEPVSGEMVKKIALEDQYFGEGCTLWEDKVYQLTWQSQIGLIYDLEFNQIGTFSYPTEGWGLTTWQDQFIMSDGSANLYFMDPEGFREVDRFEVYQNKNKVGNLNELETVGDLVYANVYGKEIVVMIDPKSGAVVGEIDFAGLQSRAASERSIDYVLNGIAYDSENDRLFVTGKLWDTIFEVQLIEKPGST